MLIPSGFMNSSRRISPGWIGWSSFLRAIWTPSMIVNDLDVVRVPRSPDEADSPPVIDADAMLSLAGAFQRLEPVARGDPQVVQRPGAVQVQQLPAGDSLEGPKPGYVYVGEQRLRVPGPERSNHRWGVYYA